MPEFVERRDNRPARRKLQWRSVPSDELAPVAVFRGMSTQRIVTNLWFDTQAEEAAEYCFNATGRSSLRCTARSPSIRAERSSTSTAKSS